MIGRFNCTADHTQSVGLKSAAVWLNAHIHASGYIKTAWEYIHPLSPIHTLKYMQTQTLCLVKISPHFLWVRFILKSISCLSQKLLTKTSQQHICTLPGGLCACLNSLFSNMSACSYHATICICLPIQSSEICLCLCYMNTPASHLAEICVKYQPSLKWGGKRLIYCFFFT